MQKWEEVDPREWIAQHHEFILTARRRDKGSSEDERWIWAVSRQIDGEKELAMRAGEVTSLDEAREAATAALMELLRRDTP